MRKGRTKQVQVSSVKGITGVVGRQDTTYAHAKKIEQALAIKYQYYRLQCILVVLSNNILKSKQYVKVRYLLTYVARLPVTLVIKSINVPHGRAGHPGEPVTFAKTTSNLQLLCNTIRQNNICYRLQYIKLICSTLRVILARLRVMPCLTARATAF